MTRENKLQPDLGNGLPPEHLSDGPSDPSPAAEAAPIAPARVRPRPTPSADRIRTVDLSDPVAVAEALARGWHRLR